MERQLREQNGKQKEIEKVIDKLRSLSQPGPQEDLSKIHIVGDIELYSVPVGEVKRGLFVGDDREKLLKWVSLQPPLPSSLTTLNKIWENVDEGDLDLRPKDGSPRLNGLTRYSLTL